MGQNRALARPTQQQTMKNDVKMGLKGKICVFYFGMAHPASACLVAQEKNTGIFSERFRVYHGCCREKIVLG